MEETGEGPQTHPVLPELPQGSKWVALPLGHGAVPVPEGNCVGRFFRSGAAFPSGEVAEERVEDWLTQRFFEVAVGIPVPTGPLGPLGEPRHEDDHLGPVMSVRTECDATALFAWAMTAGNPSLRKALM